MIYQIADLIVEMECSGRTYRQSQLYQYIGSKKETQILIDPQKEKAHYKSILYPELHEEDWEYMLTGSLFYYELLEYNGMLLHASAVVYENKAYLFSAPCGVGKSTHASLWLKQFPNAYILNDDKPAIRLINGCFYVYGTPWSGKTGLNVPGCVPLQGICFLQQSKENWIKKISSKKAVFNLMSQTTRKLSKVKMEKLFKLIEDLINNIIIYEMGCRIDDEAVQLAYQAMKNNNAKSK